MSHAGSARKLEPLDLINKQNEVKRSNRSLIAYEGFIDSSRVTYNPSHITRPEQPNDLFDSLLAQAPSRPVASGRYSGSNIAPRNPLNQQTENRKSIK